MKLLSIAIVTLASASALAATKSTTEYYYQPTAGVSAIQARYLMDMKPMKSDTGGVETDQKSEIGDFYLDYLYGMSEGNALGVELVFGSNKLTNGATSHTATGMGDINLFYRGFSGMWHYGANIGVNTEKVKEDAATGLQDNRSSGGMSLKLNVGVMQSKAETNYGVDLSYAMPFERQFDDAAGTKLTGGNTLRLAPFVEYNWGMGFVGAELAYNMMDDTTVKAAAEVKVKGESYLSLILFGSYDFNESTTGLLSLGMASHPEHDFLTTGTTKMKAYTETLASIGVRYSF